MISDIYKLNYGKATAYIIKLEKSVLLILETDEMEDIPYTVVKELKKTGQSLAFKHTIIVDAHNSLQKERYTLSQEVIKELIIVGKKGLKKALELSSTPFKVSVIKIDAPGLTPKQGLGKNGIGIFLWETFSGYNAIICIDSNNLSPTLRELIKNKLKEIFNVNALVVTTDTHEVTALQLNKRGYVILGEDKKDKMILLEAIEKGVTKAIETLRESEGLIYEKSLKGRVLGMNTLERMRDMLSVGYSTMKRLLYNFILPLCIIHIVWIYLSLLLI
jgi:predicted neutral ceramidase superfamily lipid hydrolase